MTVPRTYTLSAVQCIRLAGLAGVMFAVMVTVAASAGFAAVSTPSAAAQAARAILESFTFGSPPSPQVQIGLQARNVPFRLFATGRKVRGGGDGGTTGM